MAPTPPKPLQCHISRATNTEKKNAFQNSHNSHLIMSIAKYFRKNTEIFLDKTTNPVYNNKADFGNAEVTWPYGGVTQLVEYPVHTRYVTCSNQVAATRPVGQAVKTPPFHGGNMGSIPVRVTKKRRHLLGVFFFCPYGNRKAVKKTCRWHVFRPWERPLLSCSAPSIYPIR